MTKEEFVKDLEIILLSEKIDPDLFPRLKSVIHLFANKIYDNDPKLLYSNIKSTIADKYDVSVFDEDDLSFEDLFINNHIFYSFVANKLSDSICKEYDNNSNNLGPRTQLSDEYTDYLLLRGIVDIVGDKESLQIIDKKLNTVLNAINE